MPDGIEMKEIELTNTIGKETRERTVFKVEEEDWEKSTEISRTTASGHKIWLPQDRSEYGKLDVFTQSERVWATRLVLCALPDIGLSLIVAIVAFSTAYRDVGATLACIGIQSLCHWASSLCIILRWWKECRFGRYASKDGRSGVNNDAEEEEEEELLLLSDRRKDLIREQAINTGIGLVMVAACVGMLYKGFRKMALWEIWYKDHQAMDDDILTVSQALAWWCGIFYTANMVIRLIARQDLHGHKFANHIWLVSLSSCIFMFMLGVTASFPSEKTWKIEAIGSILMGFAMFGEGVRLVYVYADDIDHLMRIHQRP